MGAVRNLVTRLRLDLHPAAFAGPALAGMFQFCAIRSEGALLWSVLAAYRLGSWIVAVWWIWSDARRRGFPLLPVWGLWFTLADVILLFVYLFASRGWWAWVTLLLYGLIWIVTVLLVGWLA